MRKNNRKKILVLGCAIGLILTGCGNQTANTQQTGSTQEIHTTAITGEQKQETETQELTSEERVQLRQMFQLYPRQVYQKQMLKRRKLLILRLQLQVQNLKRWK